MRNIHPVMSIHIELVCSRKYNVYEGLYWRKKVSSTRGLALKSAGWMSILIMCFKMARLDVDRFLLGNIFDIEIFIGRWNKSFHKISFANFIKT